ncbi:(2Fe-2S)-binding protein [Streptomyces sp. NPDC007369]|uniref:(2Fe-2S)-binding protein n=1 Tax=Streptomyces sp. NPDC007369 TaxID=3154589 RepID=UPI00340DEBF1
MSENENVSGTTGDAGGGAAPAWGWEPVPQSGEFTDAADATAFVSLPPGMLDALAKGEPLAAPGHGYVPPPMIVPLGSAGTDPSATGTWAIPAQWPDEGGHPAEAGRAAAGTAAGAAAAVAGVAGVSGVSGGAGGAPAAPVGGPIPASIPIPAAVAAEFADAVPGQEQTGSPDDDPGETAEWHFPDALRADEPVTTGQWTLPELHDQTGEFRPGTLDADWSQAPATLPGGAPAPWATHPGFETPHADAPLSSGVLPDAQSAAGGAGTSGAGQRLLGGPGVGAPGPRVLGGPGVGTPLPEGEPAHPAPYDIEAAHAPAAAAAGLHAPADAYARAHEQHEHGQYEHGQYGHVGYETEHGHGHTQGHGIPLGDGDGHTHGQGIPLGDGDGDGHGHTHGHGIALGEGPGHAHGQHGQAQHEDVHADTPAGVPAEAPGPRPGAEHGIHHPATAEAAPAAGPRAETQPSEAQPAVAPVEYALAGGPAGPAGQEQTNGHGFPASGHAAGPEQGPEREPEREPEPQPAAEPGDAPGHAHDHAHGHGAAAEAGPELGHDPDRAAAGPADEHGFTGAAHGAAAEPAAADGHGFAEAAAGAPGGAAGGVAPGADAADGAVPPPDASIGEGIPLAGPSYGEEQAAAAAVAHHEHPLASYVLRVNGADRPVTGAWIGESLLYVLRERLGLAGAKDGCSQGECGACAVQVDGRLVASCLVPAATAAGSEVRTVEGLASGGELSDVQQALCRSGAVQCGFCVPGMAMTIHDLLEGNHAPSDLETRQALCGNLCRCSGYKGVLEAVREVVAERADAEAAAAEAAAAAEGGGAAGAPRIPHQAQPGEGGIHHNGGMA